ncbi:MAG: hypothetical protein ABSH25_11340 [Syntrophorhabdales bacterium]|jgi:hypothetical protein
MANTVLLWIGSLLPILWGIAHLFPTGSIVKGFGSISEDNRRIITMEWITEGVALMFIGSVALTATIIDRTSHVSVALHWISVVGLNILSIVSLFTGFRIRFLPFRLCPAIFTGSSVLIVLGLLL